MKRFCFRVAASALALAMFFSSAAANAYTSTGADGAFQPTVSVALDPAQQVFNFTDIFIPGGVTVSFGGLTSAQQILLLATGNIGIAGTLDAGANSLWIETPGSISLTGSLNTQGGNLTLVSGGVLDVSGTMSALRPRPALPAINFTVPAVSWVTSESTVVVNNLVLTPIPETEVWVMLSIGFCALFAASRRRHQHTRIA
jgi:hypothetical protein